MKHLFFLLLILFPAFIMAQNKTISIEYVKKGEQIKLKDDFKIVFIVSSSNSFVLDSNYYTIRPKIKDNSFIVPNIIIGQSDTVYVFFQYKNEMPIHISFFYNFRFTPEQNMLWRIGFDKKTINKKSYYREMYLPFDYDNDIDEEDIPKDMYPERVEAIVYRLISPLEFGEGVVHYAYIWNYKNYYKVMKQVEKLF